MKFNSKSLSKRQRQQVLIKAVNLSPADYQYVTTSTTTRIREFLSEFDLMVRGKAGFDVSHLLGLRDDVTAERIWRMA